MPNIFKNINLNYIKKKSISLGVAFLLTSVLPVTTVIIRGMSEESKKEKKIKVYDSGCNKDIEISMKELIIGGSCMEMPISWNEEAIKAQMVALHSYFLYQNEINSVLELNYKKGSYIKHFAYISLEKRKERWGDKFEEYEEKAEKAFDAVKNQVLYYNNKPILAMFFSCCYKNTVPYSAVSSQDFPYLTEVESPECNFMNLEKNFEISKSEMAKILKEKFSDDNFSQKIDITNPKDWFEILETRSNGYVLKIKILDKEITGYNFRHMIGTMKVRSANFVINYNSEKEIFVIKALGFGHNFGMSQYGAKFMADQNYTYDKILAHYYPNTEIKQI